MRHAVLRGFAALCLLFCARAATAWDPPIGVPYPPFGIDQVAGTFTHYVDNTHPARPTRTIPTGHPSLPRLTVPTSTLPAGSVVEVRGGPYSVGDITWRATARWRRPCSSGGSAFPVFQGNEGHIDVGGSHLIVEGLVLRSVNLGMENGGHRLVVRFNEIGVWPSEGPTSWCPPTA